jgi:hypothetical protein
VAIAVQVQVVQAVARLEEITLLHLLLLQLTLAAVEVEAVVEVLAHHAQEVLAALESSLSRLTNKDIHAKQSLSILWN